MHKRVLLLEDINKKVAVDAAAFIDRENRRYFSDLEAVVRELATGIRERCLVLLSGPSSSGKTTTALAAAGSAPGIRDRRAHGVSG